MCVVLGTVVVVYQSCVCRSGVVAASIAQAVRNELLEAMKEAATEPNMRVSLRGFWRGQGWNWRQRYAILEPLIEKRILHLPEKDDIADHLFQQLGYRVLMFPPSTVVLNTRDWTRMATDHSQDVPSIIVGQITGGNVQFGDDSTINQRNAALSDVTELIKALRADAEVAPNVAEAATTTTTADQLEAEVTAGRWGKAADWIQRAAELVNESTAAMDNTRKALELFT